MRKLLLLVTLLLMCLTLSVSVQGKELAFWALGEQSVVDPDNSLLLRFGQRDEAVEFGGQTIIYPELNDSPDVFGIYGFMYYPILDVNNPFAIEGVENLKAEAYFGGQITVDFGEDDKGAYTGLVAGTVFNEFIVLEYQYNRLSDQLVIGSDHDSSVLYLGLRIPF